LALFISEGFFEGKIQILGMEIIALLLIAIALAMDSFAVSISAGIVLKHYQFNIFGKISIMFALFQGLMPVLGWWLGQLFEETIKAYDHWIAFILLGFIGGKMIYEALKNDNNTHCLNPYCIKTVAALAFLTSIDALAVGITFSLLDVEIIFPAIIIGITTLIFSFLGLGIGVKLGAYFGNKIEFFGGVILILIGVKILIEHLFFQ